MTLHTTDTLNEKLDIAETHLNGRLDDIAQDIKDIKARLDSLTWRVASVSGAVGALVAFGLSTVL